MLRLRAILSLLLLLVFSQAMASHIVGGEFTYVHVGDSTVSSVTYHIYTVSLSIYEDCLNGNPDAIAQDNPAFIGVFDAVTEAPYEIDENINFVSAITVPPNFDNSCASDIQPTCLIKKTFVITYALPANPHGYVIAYERCCRNASIINIQNPDQNGSTFYCRIPAGNMVNNSAVFKKYPPQIICLNVPLVYDNSATDADIHDSLSYGFCTPLETTNDSAKPTPSFPDWNSTVAYIPPFTAQAPVISFPPLQIDPVSGLITGTPTAQGRFLVSVYCVEWRNGVSIDTIKREFQFVVQPCKKTVVANMPQFSTDPNTYIIDCKDYTVNFLNTSTGGFAYHWDFGVPGTGSDTSDQFEPTFTYPDTGTFTVNLVVNPGSTCSDSIQKLVKIYPTFTAAFSDSGNQCPGSPIFFKDLTSSTMKPITSWAWSFGDGNSSASEAPVHSYAAGGTYNVTLASQNAKHCTDTAMQQVVIETFKPFAGDDTIIVKGEKILFDATGGITYTWTPSTNLSDTNLYDPTGYYPDTGRYSYFVHVISAYGCTGDDTINVRVVANAEFIVPTAFTPNGDGNNDYFRPVAVGYQRLNYFRIFDRWGHRVYESNSLEVGWDGIYNNAHAEIGTYYWEISYVDRYGKGGTMKGDVTLIR